jgi:cytochrome c-type biogenesis protein
LLGAVWSPCVGPTLGAASLLASQGHDLLQVALTMAVFGIGAALPLILLGVVARDADGGALAPDVGGKAR